MPSFLGLFLFRFKLEQMAYFFWAFEDYLCRGLCHSNVILKRHSESPWNGIPCNLESLQRGRNAVYFCDKHGIHVNFV
jgi:hypothetical protein